MSLVLRMAIFIYEGASQLFYASDYKYFDKARQAALISDFPRPHIGCVAVYHGQVIAAGFNRQKTHPRQRYYNRYRIQSDSLLPKLHAEIACINQIKNLDINFSKVKLYIFRTREDQPCGMGRPCPSCIAAIKDIGIREIYYTTNDGYAFEEVT